MSDAGRLADEFLSGNSTNESNSRSRNAAALIDEFLKNQPPETDRQYEVGGGLRGMDRARLAFGADTAAEKQAIFQKRYPEGDVVRRNNELYFRKTQEEAFQKIDPSMFSDPGKMRDLPLDVLEFVAQEGPVLAAELAAFSVLKKPPVVAAAKAKNLLGQVLSGVRTRPGFMGQGKPGMLENTARAAAGGFVGEQSRQLAQALSGTQFETPSEQLSRSAQMGIYSGLGEVATKPLVAVAKAAKGIPLATTLDNVGRALGAEKRFRLPHLTPGQTVRNPILARWERMGRTLSTRMITHFDNQIKEASRTWRGLMRSNADASTVTRNIRNAVAQAEKNIWNPTKRRLRWKALDSDQTGRAILDGVMKWDDLASKEVNRLYDVARAAGTPVYDISGLRTISKEISEGVRYSADPKIVNTGLLDETGKVITRESPQSKRIGEGLQNGVARAIKTINEMKDGLPSVTHSNGRVDDGTEQLNKLRQSLWDLKTPAAGDVLRQEHRDAAALYSQITKALKNPIVDTSESAELWSNAAKAASDRFTVLDKSVLAQILKTRSKSGSSQLIRSIVANGKQSDIIDLKEILKGTDFAPIIDSVAADIFENPSLLKTMDQDVLKEVFSREPGLLKDMGEIAENISLFKTLGSGMTKAFNDNVNQRKAMMQFFKTATPRDVANFLEMVSGQPESASLIKQMIIDGIGDVATAGGKEFDAKAFVKQIKDFADVGLFTSSSRGIFTKDEMRNINELRKYLMVSSGMNMKDVGTSMQAAELVSPVGGVKAVPGMLKGIALVGGLGKLLTSKAFSRIIRGRSRTIVAGDFDPGFVKAIAATLAADLGRDSNEEIE